MESTNTIEIDEEHLKLHNYFKMIIAGPSQCGKSVLLFNLLDNLTNCIDSKFGKIVFIYGAYQPIYTKYPYIQFTKDLEVLHTIKEGTGTPTLLILDDVMSDIKDSKLLEDIFTHGRHQQISTILVMQNLFYPGSALKTMRNNADYYAVFEHLQDASRLMTFASQLELKNSLYFKEALADMEKNTI